MKRVLRSGLVLLAAVSVPVFALSPASQERLQKLQDRWVETQYEVPEKKREAAFEALAQEADQAVSSDPKSAELLIWRGIIQSCWAGAKGGLGALGLAKEAKQSLEQAMALDPNALSGSAYASLGSLYYQVPGWPIGFGDNEKAESLLKKALVINPTGIDPNYFYGDFLMRQKRYPEAKAALEKALNAPARPNRANADAHRKEDIQKLLSELAKK